MHGTYCVILTAVGSQEEAARLADLLVSRGLAACVQAASIASTYLWKGQVNHDAEYLLLIKTREQLYEQVQAAIVENHSYETPEIVLLPITQGLDRYLGWIDESTSAPD